MYFAIAPFWMIVSKQGVKHPQTLTMFNKQSENHQNIKKQMVFIISKSWLFMRSDLSIKALTANQHYMCITCLRLLNNNNQLLNQYLHWDNYPKVQVANNYCEI